MRSTLGKLSTEATETVRSDLRDTEGSFGSVITDVAILLYPPPNTAAQIAAELGCSVRNVELYIEGKQKWSGDALALVVSEIMRRHRMRNFRVKAR